MPNWPTLRRRRLARELSVLRESIHMTIEEAAANAGISPSHLSRVERALVGVRVPVVRALLMTYGADAPTVANLVEVAQTATQRGWWHRYAGSIPDDYATYIGFESDASRIWNFELISIPGLMQTEGYTRAILQGGVARLTEEEIERRVEVRMRRQSLLHRDDPPALWVVLDEAAIRRQVGGPQTMAEQMQRLATIANLPHVDVQVIPFGTGAHPGTPGSFVVLGFADPADRDVVYIETMAGDLYPEGDADVQAAVQAFDRLRAMALSPNDSASLIQDAVKELA
ncbi:helix-turn-helix transcriptional regulator [Plantactinospora sp. WMMB334]|uniref:helix-turn-helix domain-containing protein n=1 Tax=unclassified Plantactinospora TaxID=2631981 RepID=UPI002982450D|nr:helix-turn-helix transcriptional regulator [Plantactinospora sp. KLBMP9567]MDW5325351.1 helix-turn-helix transcriptional regulator [Plantactinospora sp. KLBMP9567]